MRMGESLVSNVRLLPAISTKYELLIVRCLTDWQLLPICLWSLLADLNGSVGAGLIGKIGNGWDELAGK